RGDVIDIFPAESEREAVRVELFDDSIDSLTLFDPLTGAIGRKVPRFTVYPGTHYVTPRERLVGAVDQIREDLRVRLKDLRDAGRLLEAQRLEQRTRFDMEMIQEVGYCAGIENYSRYLSGRAPGEPPPCLFDYLPRNALLFVDESHQTIPQLGAMYRGDRSRKEVLVEYGFRLPSALDNRPLKFEEWEQLAPQMIFVSATPGGSEAKHSSQVVEELVRPTGLVDHLRGVLGLVAPGGRGDENHLRRELLPLLELQRPVVQRRGQPEAVLDQHLLARTIPAVHRPELRDGLMALIDEQQRVARQVVEQARRGLPGRAPRQIARVILDARAVADLLDHFHVEAGALLEPLRFQQPSRIPQLLQAHAQIL